MAETTHPLYAHPTIHDVRPDTLDRVETLLGLLEPEAPRVGLLVVPGLDWGPEGIQRLRSWVARGHELAGHGWVHQRAPSTLYHHVHGAVVSRDQAEHLSASRAEVMDLVARGRAWFDAHDLPAPTFYVPPAWALGAVEPRTLAELGYRSIEVQWGFHDLDSGRFHATPLIGFEADTWWRDVALRAFNALHTTLARRTGRPLRLGLHPFDLELRRSHEVRRRLDEVDVWLDTGETLGRLRRLD